MFIKDRYIAEKFLMDVLQQCPHLDRIYHEQEAQFPMRDPYCLIQSKIACEYTLEHILQSASRNNNNLRSSEQLNDFCNRVIIASAWQYTRSVYRFDSVLYEALVKQNLEAFPDSILEDLPEPSIFIETKNDLEAQEGFFAQVDKKDNAYVLLLMFISSKKEPLLTQLPIKPHKNFSQLIDDIVREYSPTIGQRHYIEKRFKEALNLILYFGCKNVDYSSLKEPSYKKSRKPKKTTQYYTMGKTIGNALLQASQEGKLPYVRRAHYHHYWTGKRDGERKRVKRFVYPVFVNCNHSQSKENLSIKTRYKHIKESD